MVDSIRIGTLEVLGISTAIEVEEGRNFRRIALRRYRLMFGDLKKVGEAHIYMGQTTEFRELLDNAEWVMERMSEVGFEAAAIEWAQERGKA